MSGKNVIIVNEKNFQIEVLSSKIPVLIDFMATWCKPCKQIAPMIEELANETIGRLKVVQIDVDQSRSLAAGLTIKSVPTLIFFRDGKEIGRDMSRPSKSALKEFFKLV